MSASIRLLKAGCLNPWLDSAELAVMRYGVDKWTAKELARNATIRERRMVGIRRSVLRHYFRRIQRETAILACLRPTAEPTLTGVS